MLDYIARVCQSLINILLLSVLHFFNLGDEYVINTMYFLILISAFGPQYRQKIFSQIKNKKVKYTFSQSKYLFLSLITIILIAYFYEGLLKYLLLPVMALIVYRKGSLLFASFWANNKLYKAYFIDIFFLFCIAAYTLNTYIVNIILFFMYYLIITLKMVLLTPEKNSFTIKKIRNSQYVAYILIGVASYFEVIILDNIESDDEIVYYRYFMIIVNIIVLLFGVLRQKILLHYEVEKVTLYHFIITLLLGVCLFGVWLYPSLEISLFLLILLQLYTVYIGLIMYQIIKSGYTFFFSVLLIVFLASSYVYSLQYIHIRFIDVVIFKCYLSYGCILCVLVAGTTLNKLLIDNK